MKRARTFKAKLEIIGVNPFVFVPIEELERIFQVAGRDKGPIPIKGTVNQAAYRQTLVRYKGEWRLYINTTMLQNSPKRVGEVLSISVDYDAAPRIVEAPMLFKRALRKHPLATKMFSQLPPSRRQEIVRYLAKLKSKDALIRNVDRAIRFLQGESRFIGRDRPQ